MVEILGLGRAGDIPPDVVVPEELAEALGRPALGEVGDGLRIGLIGGPEPSDPALLRIERAAGAKGITVRVSWSAPLAHALSQPGAHTNFGGSDLLPGDLLVPGPGPFHAAGHGLYDPTEAIFCWEDLRRDPAREDVGDLDGRPLDGLSALARAPRADAAAVSRALTVMAALRGEKGCPWDREQDHLSLRRYILEEAAETVDALTSGVSTDIREELGDLLLQVLFQARLFEEEHAFTFEDVAANLATKLVWRHPHVFGKEVAARDAAAVLKVWERVKARENTSAKRGLLARVPESLAAYDRLCAMLRVVAELGIDVDRLAAPADGLVRETKLLERSGASPELAVREAVTLLEAGLARVDLAASQAGVDFQKWDGEHLKTAFFQGIEAKLAGKKKD